MLKAESDSSNEEDESEELLACDSPINYDRQEMLEPFSSMIE